MSQPKTWAEVTKPIVAKLEIAAMFGKEAVFNQTGAKALADVIKTMARLLDDEVKARVTLGG